MSIKIVYDNIIKRISQVDSLDSMKQAVWKIFPELTNSEINVIYIKGVEKILILSDEEFKNVINLNKKFFIEKNTSKDSDTSLIKNNFSVFNSTCSTCNNFPIIGEKYICIVCEEVSLCQKCETTHNHPMIKLKTDDFQTNSDIITLIQSNKSLNIIRTEKPSLISLFKDKISKPKYKVILEMVSKYYIIKPNTEFNFQIILYNEGENSLPPDTVIYVKNNKNFYVEMKKLNKVLWPGSMEYIDLKCKTGWAHRTFVIETHIYSRDMKIEYVPMIFTVRVCDDIYEENKDYEGKPYSEEDTVSILPNDKKEVLCEIIKNDLSGKDIREICDILEKYNWKLTEEALNEIK